MREQDERLYLKLCRKNTEKIYRCEDAGFRKYGLVHNLNQTDHLMAWADDEVNPDGPVYVPHYKSSESTTWKKELEQKFYGAFPMQVGSCCGMNQSMNGMEYHKGHEYIVALTPLVLFLGHSGDLKQDDEGQWSWKSSYGRFFFVPKGTTVELYSTTMHLAPCRISEEPFQSLILLPDQTNLDLDEEPAENSLLFKKNKWMICHPDSPAAKNGAYVGIKGENRSIQGLESL